MADIQLVLIEADEQTRLELRKALRAQVGMEVASEATNAETGLVLLESIDVDVAVMDGTLPDLDLATFLQRARELQADSCVTPSKFLALITPDQVVAFSRLQGAGAESYCLKTAPVEQLAEAVRQTYAGQTYLDPQLQNVAVS
jgi:anaerobic magnesium-protoporphyrin IX monomethyl ester cyclase